MGCGASARYSATNGSSEAEVWAKPAQPNPAQPRAPVAADGGGKSYRTNKAKEKAATAGSPSERPGELRVEAVAEEGPDSVAEVIPAAEVAQTAVPMQQNRVEENVGAVSQDNAVVGWGYHEAWVQQRACDILAAYNFFFEHIGIRKGWRIAPFAKEDVQAPFQAAAEVVTLIRAKLDIEKGGGVVLRQLEGSAMNFLWGWSPGRSPCSSQEALSEFFRGLVFATLSDGHGLVEGLDSETIEQFIACHPIVATTYAPEVDGEHIAVRDEE